MSKKFVYFLENNNINTVSGNLDKVGLKKVAHC